MNFKRKLSLDESLFDDDIEFMGAVMSEPQTSMLYDDDFSAPDYMPDTDAPVLPGPQTDVAVGVASLLMDAITGEYDTINDYNSIIATIQEEGKHQELIPIIQEINNEEMKHVGQLQELLKKVSPNAASIEVGEQEGKEQLKFVNGKLPVQTMDTSNYNSATPNVVDETCTITNVDDEM